ncbi:MAG: TetR/AcrR family transcriptional regulator [Nannocystaceae bacterium]|nr:TetR/AcrR family transcriptional regulator [bacterium]
MSPQPQHSPRKRLQEAKRALYREAILDAAEREFAAHGYEQAKVTAIAKGAGVSLATLYGTFPKKHDVYRALQKDRLEQLMRDVGAQVLAAKDPFERLRGGIEGYLRFHMEHPDYLRGQLREGVPWGTTDQLRTPEQTQAWEAGRVMMMTAFEAGMDEGWFVRDDPELCARTATAMSQVRLSLWIDRDLDESPDAVARAAMQQLLRAFAEPAELAALLERL